MKILIPAIIAITVAILLIGLYLFMPASIQYDGSEIVESGSMQHSDDNNADGIIDDGDIVYYNSIESADDIVTYVDGEGTDYSKCGAYGDVIIYWPNGDHDRHSIIHRAVIWLEINNTGVSDDFDGIDFANYTFDVPSLGKYNTTDNIVLENYGYEDERVDISLRGLISYYNFMNKEPHGGFITMGDYNAPTYDQPLNGSYESVLPEWVVGKIVHLKDID